MRHLTVETEVFDLHTQFSISRLAKQKIIVVTVILQEDGYTGRGECRPYERYDETPQSVTAQIEAIRPAIEGGLSKEELQDLLPAGAARNAVDCALWDLESRQKNKTIWQLLGISKSNNKVPTLQSLSLASPDDMAECAVGHKDFGVLKIKLGGDPEDLNRLKAIRTARPDANLVIDANEGWTFDQFRHFVDQAQNLGVMMIEQPLPKAQDELLADYDSGALLICGDESIHTVDDLNDKIGFYDMVNVKLDKAGGLTHALKMLKKIEETRQGGGALKLMVGCMVCTSLAIAPHIVLAQYDGLSDLNDLDGPGWLKQDRSHGVRYENGHIIAGTLWGNL